MRQPISHSRADETPEARACRFQSLTLEDRADWLCEFTDFVLEVNPKIMERKNTQPVEGRIQVLKKA